jgi:hypothetical protein
VPLCVIAALVLIAGVVVDKRGTVAVGELTVASSVSSNSIDLVNAICGGLNEVD